MIFAIVVFIFIRDGFWRSFDGIFECINDVVYRDTVKFLLQFRSPLVEWLVGIVNVIADGIVVALLVF